MIYSIIIDMSIYLIVYMFNSTYLFSGINIERQIIWNIIFKKDQNINENIYFKYDITDMFLDERLQMLDDSLSRERNFPNQSPAHDPASTQGNI